MRDTNRRLVILSDVDDGGEDYPWYLYVWDFAVETDYSNHHRDDLTCDYNRGEASNDLFILNAFVTNALTGIGLIDSAAVVNAPDFLMPYCLQCAEETGKRPNFVTIDFHEVGDPFSVVDELNALPLSIESLFNNKIQSQNIKVFPNPLNTSVNKQVQLELKEAIYTQKKVSVSLHDFLGRKVLTQTINAGQTSLQLPQNLQAGQYIISLRDVQNAALLYSAKVLVF